MLVHHRSPDSFLLLQTDSERSVHSRLLDRASMLVERGLQGGVPVAVPVQVPAVVLLSEPRALLQRPLLHDRNRLHLDATRPRLEPRVPAPRPRSSTRPRTSPSPLQRHPNPPYLKSQFAINTIFCVGSDH